MPTPSHHNPSHLQAIWGTLIKHFLQNITLQMITWTGHVLAAHKDSIISTIIEYFLPLKRIHAWIAATHSLSQSLFPSLWVTDTLYGAITRIISDNFLTEEQWPHHIPLSYILS